LPLGNSGKLAAGAPPSALFTWAYKSSERLLTLACSLASRLLFDPAIRLRSVPIAVVEPNTVLLLPSSEIGPLVLTEYWIAVLPVRNTALPLALTQVSVAVPLPLWNRSPMRPPQPELAPSGLDACQ
jgi:hypothetical protein